MPQGVILPESGFPLPKFTFSPTAPGEDQDVLFDASSSIAACMRNPADPNNAAKCTPGDGHDHFLPVGLRQRPDGQRQRVTTRFATRGTYAVQLIVTNDRGYSNRYRRSRGRRRRQPGRQLRPVAGRRRGSTSRCSSTPTRRRRRLAGRSPATTGTSATATAAAASSTRTASREPALHVTLTVTDSAGRTGTASKARDGRQHHRADGGSSRSRRRR